MNNPSFSQAMSNPLQTLDLSTGLGYGLFYQPVIGSGSSSAYPVLKKFSLLSRYGLRRRKRDHRR